MRKGREVPKKLHLLLPPGKVLSIILRILWRRRNSKVKKCLESLLLITLLFFLHTKVLCHLFSPLLCFFHFRVVERVSFCFKHILALKLLYVFKSRTEFLISRFFRWKIVSICTLLFCIIKRKRLCLFCKLLIMISKKQ